MLSFSIRCCSPVFGINPIEFACIIMWAVRWERRGSTMLTLYMGIWAMEKKWNVWRKFLQNWRLLINSHDFTTINMSMLQGLEILITNGELRDFGQGMWRMWDLTCGIWTQRQITGGHALEVRHYAADTANYAVTWAVDQEMRKLRKLKDSNDLKILKDCDIWMTRSPLTKWRIGWGAWPGVLCQTVRGWCCWGLVSQQAAHFCRVR